LGAFPADDPFPDKVVPPSAETLSKLPIHVRLAASQEATVAPGSTDGTILKRLRRWRNEHAPEPIFKWAQRERKAADLVSTVVGVPAQWISIRFARLASLVRAVLRRIVRGPAHVWPAE